MDQQFRTLYNDKWVMPATMLASLPTHIFGRIQTRMARSGLRSDSYCCAPGAPTLPAPPPPTPAPIHTHTRAASPRRYAPLKAMAAGLRQELAALQKRVVAEELKARRRGALPAPALMAAGFLLRQTCSITVGRGDAAQLGQTPLAAMIGVAAPAPSKSQAAGGGAAKPKCTACCDGRPASAWSCSAQHATPPQPTLVPSLQAHKAASNAQAARQELAVAEQRCQDYKAALVEAQAEGAAAREAQQRLQQQLAGEQRRVEKVRAGSVTVKAALCASALEWAAVRASPAERVLAK